MKTLYIIGNGFDIAHGLNTTYWNFRNYLIQNHPNFIQKFERLYGIETFFDFDDQISESSKKQRENRIKECLWNEFENQIGHPYIDYMLDISEFILKQLDLDIGLIGIKDTMDSYWSAQYGYVKKMEQYLKEWIESIDTSIVKPKRLSLVKSSDYFLSFNYTDLLEKIYKIEDVLHIHGGVHSAYDVDPIMGHHNNKDIEIHKKKAYEEKDRFAEGEASIHQGISNYLQSLYKDTERIIFSKRYFWDKLKDVDEVIIFGWSIGSADLSYLKKIRESVDQNAKWIVYYYDSKAYTWLIEVLNSLSIDQTFGVHYIPASEFWD